MNCNKTCNVEACQCKNQMIDCLKMAVLAMLIVIMSVFLVRGCELTINYNGDPMASAGFEIPDNVTVTWKDR
jgi:hypothetical protein